MKKTLTIGKATLSLLLCCIMLSCSAFASGPVEVYHLGDLTITFGGEPPAIEPYSATDLINLSVNIGHSYTRIPSVTAKPADGNQLSIRVDSIGGIDIEVECTIRESNGREQVFNKVVSPSGYFYTEVTGNGNGVNCTVEIKVRAFNANETGTANVCVRQW